MIVLQYRTEALVKRRRVLYHRGNLSHRGKDDLTMKRIGCLLAALGLVLCLNACGKTAQETPEEKTEITVFAAASMTETLQEIKTRYEAEHQDVELVFTFDSSGALKTQIMEGAVCDLFISAAPKQMNELEEAGLLAQDSRIDLLENKVALCLAPEGGAAIASFDDLAQALAGGEILFAMGNADVPVGQYTQKIFAYYGIDEAAVSGSITYGSNVKEVVTAIVEGTADCGVIYATDAAAANLTPVDTATAEMCGQVIYPAAVLAAAPQGAATRAFLDYLAAAPAAEVFTAAGFTALG